MASEGEVKPDLKKRKSYFEEERKEKQSEIALDQNPFTLTRWILNEQQKYPEAKGDLSILLNSVALACKIISKVGSKAGIFNMYGLTGSVNASKDDVKKLDAYSNDVMINAIKHSGKSGALGSEELEEPYMITGTENKYACVFDPLDGSSNIDANISVGTIFGIYRTTQKEPILEDLLQPGSKQVCAGYCVYGTATILVLTFGGSVNAFTLDSSLGEFILTQKNLQIPSKGKIYSVNEGNSKYWDAAVTEYVKNCKDPPRGSPKKARYVGSMVADVHRTILYGGIFMYPGDKKNPTGKLRLTYELNPLSFIVEAAGGKASTGTQRILDLKPTGLHVRYPCFMGSKKDVEELCALYEKEADK